MEVERLPRKAREKASHRSQILAGALELFKEKGYHNVSMHEIATKTEFSVGTLYKFFANKEDLYSALILDKAKEFLLVVDEVLSQKDDVENIIKNYVVAKIGVIKDNLAVIRLLFETAQGINVDCKTGLRKILHETHEKEINKVASVLKKGIASKTFRKLDGYHLSVALGALIDGFMINWLENPDSHPYSENAGFILELFFNGCLAAGKPMRLVK